MSEPTESLRHRLRALATIMSIPAREKWPSLARESNVYSYWAGIGLLDDETARSLTAGPGAVPATAVLERFFRNVDYYWHPRHYAGRWAADIGSGYGHLTMWLLLSGASRVVSVGDPERIAFVEELYQAGVREGLLPEGALTTRGSFVREGESRLVSDWDEPRLSLVMLNDTLEHVHPSVRPSLFRACFNSLLPGGRLISRQHNSDCPRTLGRLTQVWNRFESERYLPARREYIRGLVRCTGDAVERLAVATRGFDNRGLRAAVSEFLRDGRLPSSLGAVAPVDVETGEVCEGLTTRAVVLRELRNAGFAARVLPAMGESRRNGLFQSLASVVPAPFFWFHIFDDSSVFVAVKERAVGG